MQQTEAQAAYLEDQSEVDGPADPLDDLTPEEAEGALKFDGELQELDPQPLSTESSRFVDDDGEDDD